jgi:3',5'-cyclic AMP phosphodiesterase CpdA
MLEDVAVVDVRVRRGHAGRQIVLRGDGRELSGGWFLQGLDSTFFCGRPFRLGMCVDRRG